jgi:hypothetical protein
MKKTIFCLALMLVLVLLSLGCGGKPKPVQGPFTFVIANNTGYDLKAITVRNNTDAIVINNQSANPVVPKGQRRSFTIPANQLSSNGQYTVRGADMAGHNFSKRRVSISNGGTVTLSSGDKE